MLAGTAFWDREEVKNTLSYLHLVVAGPLGNDIALDRVLNEPARGIGGKTHALLRFWAVGKDKQLSALLLEGVDKEVERCVADGSPWYEEPEELPLPETLLAERGQQLSKRVSGGWFWASAYNMPALGWGTCPAGWPGRVKQEVLWRSAWAASWPGFL